MIKNSEDKDVILKYFDNCQQDYRQRVGLKQNLLIAYAAGTSALVAFIIQQNATHPGVEFLILAIPIFSLLAASNFADHMLATTGIASYQLLELQPRLASIATVPEVLHCSSHVKPLQSIFWMLQLSQLLLIGLPSLGSVLAVGAILLQRWMALSVIARYGLVAAESLDCVCLALSLFLLRKIARNTKIFASSDRGKMAV